MGANGSFEEIKAHRLFKGVNWEDVYNKKTVSPIKLDYRRNYFESGSTLIEDFSSIASARNYNFEIKGFYYNRVITNKPAILDCDEFASNQNGVNKITSYKTKYVPSCIPCQKKILLSPKFQRADNKLSSIQKCANQSGCLINFHKVFTSEKVFNIKKSIKQSVDLIYKCKKTLRNQHPLSTARPYSSSKLIHAQIRLRPLLGNKIIDSIMNNSQNKDIKSARHLLTDHK
jgi:hypothetical protein